VNVDWYGLVEVSIRDYVKSMGGTVGALYYDDYFEEVAITFTANSRAITITMSGRNSHSISATNTGTSLVADSQELARFFYGSTLPNYGSVISTPSTGGSSNNSSQNAELTQLYELSNEYLAWMRKAEGVILYPFLDTADNAEAKNRQNVTVGYGFTFDNTGRNWDILREELGGTDAMIKTVINLVYNGSNLSQSTTYSITPVEADRLFARIAKKYIDDLNNAIILFNQQNNCTVTFTQYQFEAMFDYSYNNGLSNPANSINDPDKIIYYYLRQDLAGAVAAVKRFGNGTRRRLNQMNLFFYGEYSFVDSAKDVDLNPIRDQLGF